MAGLLYVERNLLARASHAVTSLDPAANLLSVIVTPTALAKRLVITGTG